jgi:phosphohistidine phosphatase
MAATGHLLMLLRHGIAEDAAPGESDAGRRLTGDGKRKMREVAAGMRALKLPIDVILTSPLRRARETAEIVAAQYDLDEHVLLTTAALGPTGDRDALFTLLGSHARADGILLVGHQPDMGELASVLLVGTPGLVPLPFKKAGLAAIAVASLPPRAAGTLEFFLTPGQLRRIGRSG